MVFVSNLLFSLTYMKSDDLTFVLLCLADHLLDMRGRVYKVATSAV